MCGIIAVKPYHDQKVNHELLTKAVSTLIHRGPDSQNVWVASHGNIALGHTRLSIIDLETGQQPLVNLNGQIRIIVNGEFYQYQAIRQQMQSEGYKFLTKSDSEILIALYEKYGTDCIKYLRGEFSFVLWDESRKRLFAARDRFGIKPLYYSVNGDGIALASECKALFALGVRAEWDPQAVFRNDHLFFLGQSETLFKNVEQLKPGHYLISEGNSLRVCKYWDINFNDNNLFIPTSNTEEDAIALLTSELKQSVKLRLMADVPVAAYLSGGIDSSAIVGLASLESPVEAFTIEFSDQEFNEAPIARTTAFEKKIPIHCLQVTDELIADNFPKTFWHSEATAFNAHCTAKYLLSKFVSANNFKVVLTGEGADELFGGYSFFVRDMIMNSNSNDAMKNAQLSHMNNTNKVYGSLFNRELMDTKSLINEKLGFTPHFIQGGLLFHEQIEQLYNDNFAHETLKYNPMSSLIDDALLKNIKGLHPLHKSMYLWLKSHFPNYILNLVGDRMEMAHSVEGRVPFLDHHLAELVAKLPAHYKIKETNEKYILREVAKPFILPEVYNRQKQPFVAPPMCFNKKTKMGQLVNDYINGNTLKTLPFYDVEKVHGFYNRACVKNPEDQKNDEKVIFLLLSMCMIKEQLNIH